MDNFSQMFELTLVSPAGRQADTTNPANDPVTFVRLPGGRLAFLFRCTRWLVANRRDHDIVFALDNLVTGFACCLARLVTRRPVILVLLRPTVDYFKCRRAVGMRGWKYWAGLAIVKIMTRITEAMADAAGPCSQYIAAQTKCRIVEVIPSYGVDTDAYFANTSRSQARADLGLPLDEEIVFCRSRIAPEKDPETFLGAVEILRKRGRLVQALYVGGEFEEFLRLAAKFDVPIIPRDHVHPLSELPKYYIASDVAVQTSRSEGLGLSPLESLCCGVPVVVSATGGLLETIKEKETGLLARPGDPVSTADAIEWLLENPGPGMEIAKRGRKLVEERYSARIAFADWYKLAERLLERRPR